MPNYAIARHSKLKGGSVSSSCHHTFRTKETPNADRERTGENRVLFGDTRSLREKVDERIALSDARTRPDNVECVEYLFTASHDFFFDERDVLDEEKLERWIGLNMEFLHEECGPDLIGAVLHMDETTPHIAAYRVPLKDGKLNCKYFYGTRELNSKFQTRYAEKMKPLGLERGVMKSRAQHQDIKRFYGAINAPVKLQPRIHELSDPPRVFLTPTQQNAYKEGLVKEIMAQLEPQIVAFRDKALTAEDEKRKRLAAEKLAAEKVAAAEKARDLAEARVFMGERRNQALHKDNVELRRQHELLGRALASEQQRAEQLSARGRDIPLAEVMSKLGCGGQEQTDSSVVYYSADGRIALTVKDNHAFDYQDKLVAKDSVNLLLYVFHDHRKQDASKEDTLRWLADNFGERRAVAAYLAEQEDALTDYFAERNRGRDEQERSLAHPLSIPGQEQHDAQGHLEISKTDATHEDTNVLLR